MSIFFYLWSIVSANIITAMIQPLHLWLFIIPTGSLLVGLTFLLRDMVQMKHGVRIILPIILLAMVLSAISSVAFGDILDITLASCTAFLVSELLDTWIFTKLNRSIKQRMIFSGVVGSILDSSIFVILGLSSLGVGFLTWDQVPYAIVGQAIVKILMQFTALLWRDRHDIRKEKG